MTFRSHQIDGDNGRSGLNRSFHVDCEDDTQVGVLASHAKQRRVVYRINQGNAKLLPRILEEQRSAIVFEHAPAPAKHGVSRGKKDRSVDVGIWGRL